MAKRKRLTEKQRAQSAAKRTPAWMQNGAMSTWTHEEHRKRKARKLGTFGAASGVRRIDPSEYEASQ